MHIVSLSSSPGSAKIIEELIGFQKRYLHELLQDELSVLFAEQKECIGLCGKPAMPSFTRSSTGYGKHTSSATEIHNLGSSIGQAVSHSAPIAMHDSDVSLTIKSINNWFSYAELEKRRLASLKLEVLSIYRYPLATKPID